MSGWPSGLRRQTQEKPLSSNGAFWSTYVGVGSNPTSDRLFCRSSLAAGCPGKDPRPLVWNRHFCHAPTPVARAAAITDHTTPWHILGQARKVYSRWPCVSFHQDPVLHQDSDTPCLASLSRHAKKSPPSRIRTSDLEIADKFPLQSPALPTELSVVWGIRDSINHLLRSPPDYSRNSQSKKCLVKLCM